MYFIFLAAVILIYFMIIEFRFDFAFIFTIILLHIHVVLNMWHDIFINVFLRSLSSAMLILTP